MSTVHISANKEDIANIVIMPGDPLRAQFIAETYLDNYKLINSTRNMYGYTGYYKGKRVTVMSSGMGNASIGIYSFELFKEYNVDTIIRIGTCGSYKKEINLYDLILVNNSYSNTSYGKNLGYDINYVTSSERINEIIEETAKNNGIDIIKGNIHNTDTFYNNNYEEFLKYNCLGVEMESYALFVNAKILNKEAAVILTVSDNLITANPVESDSASKTPQNLQASQASSTTPPANDGLSFSPTGPKWFAYASTNGLNVRESPDKKGKLLFKVSKGTRGVVKEKKNGWSYIQWDFNKKKGWSIDDYLIQGPAGIVDNIVNNTSAKNIENIKKEQLTQASIEKMLEQSKTIVGVAKPAPASETVIKYTNGKNLPQRGTITPSGGANIRAEASTKSDRLIKLPKGTVVGIKSVKQVDNYQWFEITYSNGAKTGWTREDNLQF